MFECCFSDSKPVDDSDVIWANWLLDRFVGNSDSSLINLFVKHGNRFSSYFSELLLRKVVREESRLSDDYLRKYLMLFDRHFTNPWIILKSIEITHKRQLYHLCLHFFEKLFETSIKLEKGSWPEGERLEPKHSMIGDYYTIKRAWDLINGEIPETDAEKLNTVGEVVKYISAKAENK